MQTKVFIVIVSYNGMPWLPKCLRSCNPFNIIVVDNNSSDGTVAFIQEEFPEITILQQNTNLGFGAANNIGISYALKKGAEYVFLLNQDAYLEQNTLNNLIKTHKENNSYGILSPIHLNGTGTKLDNNFSKYIKENEVLRNDALKQLFSQQIYDLPFVNAAAWLLPRKTIEKIGGFDPIFYHRGEDDNYCQRILYHGIKLGVVPETHVWHDRELRTKMMYKNNTEKLIRYERALKQALANINIEIESNIRIKKQIIVKTILKSLISLMFIDAIFNLNKYRILNTILPEIKYSRKKNKEVGLHYLEEL
ncbi:glycosyltransferase family 2 protein [Confluentibacter citreus]|uniref:glycosyltransferase family 2 protein n=1 Tax=Confluentibacter citreus TaxID=2007307 RepID=UPI000C29385A|nr:glycosyltransferase family 2 protein [Confluentibacter citreus]